jgi:hypothetical protein
MNSPDSKNQTNWLRGLLAKVFGRFGARRQQPGTEEWTAVLTRVRELSEVTRKPPIPTASTTESEREPGAKAG